MFPGTYCGDPPALAEIATRWNGDPLLIAVLLAGFGLAARARSRMALAGTALLALAFVSPLCAASVALFAARSVHHLLLILAALAFALAVPDARARALRRVPVLPATAAMTLTLWAWHVPAFYDAALTDMLFYWVMQATILASAIAFWLAIRHAGAVGAVAGFLGGVVQMGFLGALLTFAGRPLYPVHALAAPGWGLTGLADQQLAGLIMWAGGMVPFAIGGALLAMRGWRRQLARA